MPWVRILPREAILFPSKERAVLGVVDLFALPLPSYLVTSLSTHVYISTQFDFSIFNDSVRPRYSDAGQKKFPLIQPTYEVSGVPDMFIGGSSGL